MAERKYYLAIDIGASSGRHILGWLENGKIRIEELYRFENKLVKQNGHLCWDLEHLFHEVVEGLKKCKELERIPASIGIDTWGVDFVLLDKAGIPTKIFGKLMGTPASELKWRESGDKEILWVIEQGHPITRGIGEKISLTDAFLPHVDNWMVCDCLCSSFNLLCKCLNL